MYGLHAQLQRRGTTTAARVRSRLHNVLRWAIERGWIEHSPLPASVLARPNVADIDTCPAADRLPYHQCGHAYLELAMRRTSYDVVACFDFMLATGARDAEARALRWGHIDSEEEVVRLLGHGRPRGSAPLRCIPVGPHLAARIGQLYRDFHEHFERTPDAADLVFRGWGQEQLSSTALHNALRVAETGCRPSTLRDTLRRWVWTRPQALSSRDREVFAGDVYCEPGSPGWGTYRTLLDAWQGALEEQTSAASREWERLHHPRPAAARADQDAAPITSDEPAF